MPSPPGGRGGVFVAVGAAPWSSTRGLLDRCGSAGGTVVRNHEGQYSVWRVGEPVPGGWQEVG
ncbi:MbtH family NRPS accessory protein, partial [Streptomyces sp. NPDC047968]|uniref:MbtH family NRPS accessory protein n=1 Tax=Streptomyces sp. NPDC047968 TaxID=3155382 RepID=UPI00343C1047